MEILYILLGLICGFVIAWLVARINHARQIDQVVSNHPLFTQTRQQLEETKNELKSERTFREQKISELATSNEQIFSLRDKLTSQETLLKQLREQLDRDFQVLANRIFEEKTEKFTLQNKNQLDIILDPFKEKLKDFEAKVERVYGQETLQRIDLRNELKTLTELNNKLSSDAHNLTVALKGDNKAQGNWGELVLEKILERSGLTEGNEYYTQKRLRSVDEIDIKPDVVVMLPEERHIIIDSKVSLIAYEALVSTSDEEERKKYTKAHLDSVRSHIRLLGDKKYETAQGLNSPDFILLFMPIEAAFSQALQADPQLFNLAWDKRIVLTSPTTLLATLRTVASIWTQEKRTRNAEMISTEAGKLYEKFVGFVEDLIAVGRKLDSAKEDYESAMKKLSSGPGNLVKKAEDMKKLGAKTQKMVNPRLVERALGNEQNEESEI